MTSKTTILRTATDSDIEKVMNALHVETEHRQALERRVDELAEKLNRVQTQRSLRR